MNEKTNHNPELPEDLHGLEASLDALGEQARDSAPDELGQRIAGDGIETITSPSRGHLRIAGTDADPSQQTTWRQHWRLAASIALLVVAVVAAISQNRSGTLTGQSGPIVDADPGGEYDANAIENEWIDFETQYVAETGWDEDAFETLSNELDELELSFNSAWTLDENLNLNLIEEESL